MNLTCPKCNQRMTLDFSTSKVYCRHCGYVRPDEISGIEQKKAQLLAKGQRPVVDITFRGEVNMRAQSAFDSGHDCLFNEDIRGALQKFMLAAELQPEFVDAHLWIARVTEDDKLRREHIDFALAHDPTNAEAVRMKMVLSGRLTPEQAARTLREDGPQLRVAQEPVGAKAEELLCPQCGGHLTLNERLSRVECKFCGFSASHGGQAESDLLLMALLERKARAVRWNIGKRLVQCQQCGAEHTIPAVKLSARCRFCGSTHVILGDALDSFVKPDGLITFRISQDQARAAVEKALEGLGQRIANMFNPNRIERAEVEGVYLPFWVFDVMVEVTHTRIDYTLGIDQNIDSYTEVDVLPQVAICGVSSPPPDLTKNIMPFDYSTIEAYEPRWLAKYPAEVYNIDVDRASLEARGLAAEAMRRKHARNNTTWTVDDHGKKQPIVTRTTNRIQNMSFQLLLLPVWIATLTEVDGDMRVALVNGQTGKPAFGRTYRLNKR